MSNLTVEAVFCDDIRQELDGKLILIGVYGPEITVSKIPSTPHLSLWARVKGLSAGDHKFTLKIQAPSASKPIEMPGVIDATESETIAALSFVRFPVKIEHAGDISVTLTVDGQEYHLDPLKVGGTTEVQDEEQ